MERAESHWWEVVRAMASYVAVGYEESELTENEVKNDLLRKGFDESQIGQAYQWVEKAICSGTLSESLSMLQETSVKATRVANPMEALCLDKRVWNQLTYCRDKGLITQDLFERLIEGIRTIDMRDWDDFDTDELLTELLESLMPGLTDAQFARLLKQRFPRFYS